MDVLKINDDDDDDEWFIVFGGNIASKTISTNKWIWIWTDPYENARWPTDID